MLHFSAVEFYILYVIDIHPPAETEIDTHIDSEVLMPPHSNSGHL